MTENSYDINEAGLFSQWDTFQDITLARQGKEIADTILKYSGSLKLPNDGIFLGLAAGWAEAEVTLANNLGIEKSKIFLLDKSIPESIITQDTSNYIQRGMFDYLQDHSTPKNLGMVSLIGIEYVVEDANKSEKLFHLLSKKIIPSGYVSVHPFRKPYNFDINKYGFKSVMVQNYTSLLQFNG